MHGKLKTSMNIEHIRQEMAQLAEVTPLEGLHYAACLQTYEAASNQRALILEWFTEQVIPELSTDSTSLLSIGCGAGDLDIKILAAGRQHTAQVFYAGLEPDAGQCEKFVTRMAIPDDHNTSIEGHNTRFEDFAAERRFDLIIMVHSLYYMGDPEQAIDDALNLLNPLGRLVILIASNDSLNELSSSFWKMENAGATWFSEDLSKHLNSRGIAFDSKRLEATLDISSCCDPGSDSEIEKGNRIADFVAQVPTTKLPPRLRDMIFSYLKASAQGDGRSRWLPHNVHAFTIPSTPSNRSTLPGKSSRV